MPPRASGPYTRRTIGIERRRRERPRRRELFLATSKVEDFDRWMNVFSTTSLEKRKQHGSKGSHVFRDPNEEGRASGVFVRAAARLSKFVSRPRGAATSPGGGHPWRPAGSGPCCPAYGR